MGKEVTTRWNDLKKSFEEDSSEDDSDEGIPSCEELKGSVRTEGCLQYSCSTSSMKVEMLEKCKELMGTEVKKIVKKRLEECKGPQTTTLTPTGNTTTITTTAASTTTTTINKGVPALFVGPDYWSTKSEIILLPPQSSNCSTPDFPVADIEGYVMFSSTSGVQLCGGTVDYSTSYSDCYELKVGGKNWEKQTPMLKKRMGASQAKFGDTIYISGGSYGHSVLKSTEIRSEDGSWELSVE